MQAILKRMIFCASIMSCACFAAISDAPFITFGINGSGPFIAGNSDSAIDSRSTVSYEGSIWLLKPSKFKILGNEMVYGDGIGIGAGKVPDYTRIYWNYKKGIIPINFWSRSKNPFVFPFFVSTGAGIEPFIDFNRHNILCGANLLCWLYLSPMVGLKGYYQFSSVQSNFNIELMFRLWLPAIFERKH